MASSSRPPSSLAWRIGRGVLGTLLSVLLFAVVVVVSLFFIGRTNWGRQRILSIVLPVAKQSLVGGIRIGALDGDFTHMLVLRDVEIDDADGKLAVRLPYIGLRYNLAALAGRTLHVTAIDLHKAELHVRTLKDGRLNLAALTKPSDSPPSTGELPIRVLISGIDAQLAADYDGAPATGPLSQAAAQVRLRAGLHLRPDRRLTVDIDELGVQSSAPLNAQLALKGKVAMSLLDVAKSLALEDFSLKLSTDGTEVNKIEPKAALKGPLALETKLAGSLQDLAAQLKLALPKGQVFLQAKVNLLNEKLPWNLALSLTAIDPSALRAALPQSQIDLSMRGQGNGPSGHIELEGLSVRTAKNTLRLKAIADLPGVPQLVADPLSAQLDLSLTIEARDLSEFAKFGIGVPPLFGSLHGNIDAQLKQKNLHVASHLSGADLRGFGAALGRLQLDIDTKDLSGKVKLYAENLAAGGQKFGHLTFVVEGDRQLVRVNLDGDGPEGVKAKLALRAQPQIEGGSGPLALAGAKLLGLVADLDDLQLHRGGAKLLLAQPAQLILTQLHEKPIAELKSLALGLGELKLQLGGRFETQGNKLQATVDASPIDVKELLRIVGGNAAVPKSQLTLHLDVKGTVESPTGEMRLSGSIDPLTGMLPWRVTPELVATFANRRARGELSLHTEAANKESGSPSVKAHFDAPLAATGTIDLTLDAETTLEALRSFLPPTMQELAGTVAANIVVGGTLKQPQAAIHIKLPRWQRAPVRGEDTTLRITYKQQHLALNLVAPVSAQDGPQLLRAQLDVHVPLRLGADVNGAQLVDQLRNGAATIDLALHELAVPQIINLAEPSSHKTPLVGGHGELAVQIHGPLLHPTMTTRFDLKGLRGAAGSGVPEAPLDLALRSNYAADDFGLTLDLDVDGKPLMRSKAGTTVRIADLLRDGAKLVDNLPIHAQVEMFPMPLPPGLPIRGTIKAHGQLSGTPKVPLFTADANATELRLGDWPVGDMSLHATLDAQHLIKAKAQLLQKAENSGSLTLDAAVPLPFDLTSQALKLSLLAKAFRIDYEAQKGQRAAVRIVKGTLDSNLSVQGATPQPLVLGSLALHDGEVSTAALPQLIRDIVVVVRADADGSIRLEQAVARAGLGNLHADGLLKLSQGALRSVDLTTTINNFPIPAGSIGMWLDTKVVVEGRESDDTLRVKVGIPYGTVRLPKLSSGSDSDVQPLGPLEDVRYIDASARAAAEEIEKEEAKHHAAAEKGETGPPPLLPSRTLVTVELPPAFVVSGPEVKTNIQGHLDAELGALQPRGPVVTGEIRTLGGWVEILSRRYQLERAQVSMSGEVPPNPLLNVVISRKLDDATIYIQVGGTARKPVITFRSDPAIYDQAQVIGMVLSGSRGGSIQQQALGALSGLLVGKLKDSLGKAVPVDVIKLDVGGNDASGANQSSLEVGKYLRDNLYLSYTHRFGSPSTILRRLNNDQVGLEWYFLPDYQINLMGGDQGVGALNLYWTKRF